MGRRKENVYVMPIMHGECAMPAKVSKNFGNALELWHLRLGHSDKNTIARMSKLKPVNWINLTEKALEDVCGSWMEGKMTNGPKTLRTNI